MAVTLVIDRIVASAGRDPDAPAFIAGDQPMSYRALLALLSSTVRRMHEEGIHAGDPVALTMSQSPLHVIAFLALARLGALVVPVSATLRPADRAEIARRYEVRTVVADRADAGVAGSRLMLLQTIGARGDETRLDFSGFTPGPDAPLRLALTSGTTGAPRATLQTHARLVQRLDRMEFDVVERPRVLPPSLHITTSLLQALYALCRGGTVVFPRGYDTAQFLDAIPRHGVTHVASAPANLALMLQALPDAGPAFPTLRHVRLLGTTPSPAFLDLVRRKFSPNMYLPYSVGELGGVAMATPQSLLAEPRSSGRLLPGVKVEILDEAGHALPAGRSGEIRVSFDGMPEDYYGPDAGAGTRFRDGWFHPGDVGRISAEGLLFIEGRGDDIIDIGGRKVAPRYVESVLEDFPGVREAAVFVDGEGVAGKRIVAAIVASAPIDWKALAAYAHGKLDVRAPARYLEVDALPRNAMGKLIRSELERLRSAPAA